LEERSDLAMHPTVLLLISIGMFILIYAILALSLNFQQGYTGLPNFGLIGFYGIGAYATATIIVNGVNPIIGIILGMIIATVFGIIITLPAIRLREIYFAIITIAAAEIIRIVIRNEKAIGGEFPQLGIFNIPLLFGLDYEMHKIVSFLILVFVVICIYLILQFIIYSMPFGRVLKAIREDEDAVKALGKDPVKYKLIAFSIGAMVASLAGSMWVITQRAITPESIMPYWTFMIWIMVLLGGLGNNKGVIIGAIVITGIQQIVHELKFYIPTDVLDHNQIISLTWTSIGVLIVIVLIFLPKGIFKERKVIGKDVEKTIKNVDRGFRGWIRLLLRS
jgi:branched-chain amino acid transport system permease protein